MFLSLPPLRGTYVALAWALLPALTLGQLPSPATTGESQGAAAPAPASNPQRPRIGIGYESSFPAIAVGKWSGARLSDGQPDVSGDWSNTIANHNNFTDPQGGIPNDPAARNRPPLGPREQRAPSRVSDPADGELPYQDWARAKQQEFQAGFFQGSRPEYIEPLARCAPAGIPKSFYWHGYEIRQYPGYILFQFNSGWRIIRLNGSAHLPEKLKLWNGDSVGHWEGNTLVVDVSNLNSKARFGRTGDFASENVHIQERYVFSLDNKRYNYVATFTDPTVYTRPFTVTIPARRWTVEDKTNGWHYEVPLANNPGGKPIGDHFERICVENNGGFGQLSRASKPN